MCKQVPGFRYLAVSDPSALKRFHRFGWIVFEEGTDLQAALDQLNNQKVEFIVQNAAYVVELQTHVMMMHIAPF